MPLKIANIIENENPTIFGISQENQILKKVYMELSFCRFQVSSV